MVSSGIHKDHAHTWCTKTGWLSKLLVALSGQASSGACGGVQHPQALTKSPSVFLQYSEFMTPIKGHTTAPLAAVWWGSGQCGLQQGCRSPLDHSLTKREGIVSTVPFCAELESTLTLLFRRIYSRTGRSSLEESERLTPPSSHTHSAWTIREITLRPLHLRYLTKLSALFKPCVGKISESHKPGYVASYFL